MLNPFESNYNNTDVIRLRIRIDDTNLPVRDFGNYLTFIDRIYGRVSPRGLASYAQKRKEHLTISKVEFGSVELLIAEIFENSQSLIILFLFLKILADFLKASGEFYQAIQAAELDRAKKDEIRKRIRRESVCSNNTAEVNEQLTNVIFNIINYEEKNLTVASRFTEEHVTSIELDNDLH